MPFLQAYSEVTHSLLRGYSEVTRGSLSPGGALGEWFPPPPCLLLRLWLLCGLTLGLLPLYTEELRPCCGAASALLQPYFSTTLSLLPPNSRITQLLLTPWLLSSCSRVTPPLLSHGSGSAPLSQGYLWGGGLTLGLLGPYFWHIWYFITTRTLLQGYLWVSLHWANSALRLGLFGTLSLLGPYSRVTQPSLHPLPLPLLSSLVLTTQPFL